MTMKSHELDDSKSGRAEPRFVEERKKDRTVVQSRSVWGQFWHAGQDWVVWVLEIQPRTNNCVIIRINDHHKPETPQGSVPKQLAPIAASSTMHLLLDNYNYNLSI